MLPGKTVNCLSSLEPLLGQKTTGKESREEKEWRTESSNHPNTYLF